MSPSRFLFFVGTTQARCISPGSLAELWPEHCGWEGSEPGPGGLPPHPLPSQAEQGRSCSSGRPRGGRCARAREGEHQLHQEAAAMWGAFGTAAGVSDTGEVKKAEAGVDPCVGLCLSPHAHGPAGESGTDQESLKQRESPKFPGSEQDSRVTLHPAPCRSTPGCARGSPTHDCCTMVTAWTGPPQCQLRCGA